MKGSRLVLILATSLGCLAPWSSRISPAQQVGGTPTPFGPITIAPRILVSPDGLELDFYVDVEGTSYSTSETVYFNTAEGDVFGGTGPLDTFSDIGGAGASFAMDTLSRTAGTSYTLQGYGGVCSVTSEGGGGGGYDPCEFGDDPDGNCHNPPIQRPYVSFSPAKRQCDSYQSGATYKVYGPAVITLQPAVPQVTSLSTYSVNRGDRGILTVTGVNLVEGSVDQLRANLSGGGSPFTLTGTPSATTATFSYDFSGYPEGTWLFTVTNNEGTSSGNDFKVHPAQNYPPSAPPPDPCAVTSNPQVGFTSIVTSGTSGSSGTLTVSFGGAAYSALSPSVIYGPSSTPSSIAANMAALITKQYLQYGLSAKAFGPHIIYSGNKAIGAVSNVATGPSYSTDSTAGGAASSACYSGQPNRYYDLDYRAYIPVDNLPGPTPCSLVPLYGLDYLGDKSSFSARGYRIREFNFPATNPVGVAPEQDTKAVAGKTVNFATTTDQYHLMGGGPLPAITRNQFLEPDPKNMAPDPGSSVYPWEGQCKPPYESDFGYADVSGDGGSSSSTSANAVTTQLKGLASDPLEPQLGGIAWDLTVSINANDNTATISGWNSCYPAHQITVNGLLIFNYQPEENTTQYLAKCLVLNNIPSMNPYLKFVNNCKVRLDGSQAPCMSK